MDQLVNHDLWTFYHVAAMPRLANSILALCDTHNFFSSSVAMLLGTLGAILLLSPCRTLAYSVIFGLLGHANRAPVYAQTVNLLF